MDNIEIAITEEQLRSFIEMRGQKLEAMKEYAEKGNKQMEYFCEGVASGIEYVMHGLGLPYWK